MTNKELGEIGEELAANYLMHSGYRLLHRNWRLKGGCEIDIVAFKDNALHFVEVKTRTTTFADPLQAVNMEKIRHVGRAALQYKRFYGYTYDTHIDAIGIVFRSETDYDLHLIPDVHNNMTDYGYSSRRKKKS
ncbi:MAG: YraN family protein [Bacteroidaceae bacterium]|nr:YraN family protein [Bacteroidaceae bacterium]